MSFYVEIKSTARNVPAHLIPPSEDCTVEHNGCVYYVKNPEESAIQDCRSELETTDTQKVDVDIFKEATPRNFDTSREIRQYSKMLGVTVPVLIFNFLKYTSRVNVLANSDNFLVYLRNWADLDLRIGGTDLTSNLEAKEALLMKLQNNSRSQEEEVNNNTFQEPIKPVKILTKTYVHKGCTYFNVLRPFGSSEIIG